MLIHFNPLWQYLYDQNILLDFFSELKKRGNNEVETWRQDPREIVHHTALVLLVRSTCLRADWSVSSLQAQKTLLPLRIRCSNSKKSLSGLNWETNPNNYLVAPFETTNSYQSSTNRRKGFDLYFDNPVVEGITSSETIRSWRTIGQMGSLGGWHVQCASYSCWSNSPDCTFFIYSREAILVGEPHSKLTSVGIVGSSEKASFRGSAVTYILTDPLSEETLLLKLFYTKGFKCIRPFDGTVVWSMNYI